MQVFLNMYDYVIVTHIPAFYKVNLFNELAKNLNIFVIFIASNTVEKRADDFVTLENTKFKYEVLFDGNFQERKISQNISKLRNILKNLAFKKLIVSGWDLKEFWYLVITNKKSNNCLELESNIIESTQKGLKGLIKKLFLSRISTVFAPGKLHLELLKALNYNDEIKITKGVGIINKPTFEKINRGYQKRFLYVGRFSSVKNLKFLVEVFNELPEYSLTLIGNGEDKEILKTIAKSNIIFKEPIENKKLQSEFLAHDILILPSLSEPWGLVVEEALYFRLPVVVSQNCGASELIKSGINGFVINPNNREELRKIILKVDGICYEKLIDGVSRFSIDKKDLEQVGVYGSN